MAGRSSRWLLTLPVVLAPVVLVVAAACTPEEKAPRGDLFLGGGSADSGRRADGGARDGSSEGGELEDGAAPEEDGGEVDASDER